MQSILQTITTAWCVEQKPITCLAIFVLCYLTFSEIIASTAGYASHEWPNDLVFLVLLVVAYGLGHSNARKGKPAKKTGTTKFTIPQESYKAKQAAQTAACQRPEDPRDAGRGPGLCSSTGARCPEKDWSVTEKLIELKRSEQWEFDMRVIEDAQREDTLPAGSSYAMLISACNRCRHVETALKLFSKMLEQGVPCDCKSVSTAVANKYFKLVAENLDEARMREDGLQLLEMIQAHGLMPTHLVQNRLICAWRSKLPAHVLLAFVKMKEEGVLLSSTAYRCIMFAYERTGPEITLKFYDEMVDRGIKMDRVAYNAALCAYSHLNMTEKALEMFEQMPNRGMDPNAKSYGIIIKACACSNRAKEAVDFFDAMREQNIEPNRFAYNDAILCCLKLKMLPKALALHSDLIRANMIPCESTTQHLTKACKRRGWNRIAAQVVESGAQESKTEGLQADPSEASTEFKDTTTDAASTESE